MKDVKAIERTCIVTRRQAAPEAMIRFVRAPDGVLAPDIRSRLPGRGVWVTARAELVAEAARKQVFARQLKAKVTASPTLAEEVDQLLEVDCLQSLSMTNKAGLAIAGFGKVSAALENGAVRVLLEARDGSAEGKRKLAQAVRRSAKDANSTDGGGVETIALFTSRQLDLALGRTNVIHAALAPGGPTQAFLARSRRLAAYRGESGAGEAVSAQRVDATELNWNGTNGQAQPEDGKLDERD
ncbi:MAG: RNA-binding protein [Methylocystis sp.]|nr:RNA-binding protein [Methylocystis sp.]MBI3275853.1 RNA-binding protein [Methylocystis sp.]